MKLRTKLYTLAEDGSWIDNGAGWCDVIDGNILVVFDSFAGQPQRPQFTSQISSNPEDFQLEGGITIHFFSCFIIFISFLRYIDYMGR